MQKELNRLLSELTGFTSWWGVVKTCLANLGICDKTVTHPVPTCTDEEGEILKGIMRKYGLL